MLNRTSQLELKINLNHIRQLYQVTCPQSWGDLAATAKALPGQLNEFSPETAMQLIMAFEHLQLAGELFTDNPEQAFEILKQHAKHNFQPTLNMPATMPEYAGVLGGEVEKAIEIRNYRDESPHQTNAAENGEEKSQFRNWLQKILNRFNP